MKFTLSILLLASVATVGARHRIYPLANQNQLDGSGCSFWLATGNWRESYFQWDFASTGWINLGGSDTKLILTRQSASHPDDQSLGKIQEFEFVGPGVSVVLRTKVTWVCPKNEDYCEVWHEAGGIWVTKGTQVFSARVSGECGS